MSALTIAAIATPPGRGGIGVIRLSGSRVQQIGTKLLGSLPQPRQAALRSFRDAEGQPLDVGVALFFPGPASYTGEDVLELQAHGGPVILDLILARVLELGARPAQPGEFSQRAFLNGKIDLAQAEAVADLIDSGSVQAARAALRSLRGEFSNEIQSLTEALIETRMYVEASIDFPEEEVDFLSGDELRTRFANVRRMLARISDSARQGALLREGMTVVIAGKPNAGKSSLLNRLAGYDAAIVATVPGTTRDVLRERIHIDGLPLHILDTAGLRSSEDAVELEGMRRARTAMANADRILYLVDASVEFTGTDVEFTEARLQEELAQAQLPEAIPITVVLNKIDLLATSAAGLEAMHTTEALSDGLRGGIALIALSAMTGEGIDRLREHLKECVGFQVADAGTLSARRRHLDALKRATLHLDEAEQQLQQRVGELMAEELRLAQQCLGEITGEFTSDDLLGRIFSTFCIGK